MEPESVFGKDFDLADYMAKRALELEDLDDRRFYKTVTEKMMLELFEHLQKEQLRLEERVFSSLKSEQSAYVIYTGITDRAHYDASDTFLTPICAEDVEPLPVLAKDAFDAETPMPVDTVFLRHNAQEAKRFAPQTYSGTVTTDKGTFQASFRVLPSRRYLEQIEQLYHVFLSNHIPWTTVCGVYLYKMFDVYLSHAEGWDGGTDEVIQSAEVDFGAYAPFVEREMIPLWNLSPVEKHTSAYPTPCGDHIHYEHIVFAHRLRPGCRYLIRNAPPSLQGTRYMDGDLYITCSYPRPAAWKLFQFNPKPERMTYAEPVFTNQTRKSFASDLSDCYRRSVKTKGELRRVMESYGYGDYAAFQDAELAGKAPVSAQTYDMDAFVTDEFRKNGERETLLLRFLSKDAGNYLNMDIMSFLVTQAQKLFPEYDCKGIFV